MQRGNTRRVPVSSSHLPLGVAAPAVRNIHEMGTPALQHRGTLPNSGLPRAYDPFRFTQDRRQLTAAVVDDCNDPGGSGSLAYQAAKQQYAQRTHAAQQSCQATNRAVIIDFDSNQSDCSVFADCASDNRTLPDRDAYVGQISLRLPDPITSIRAHRLLYASIPSYELLIRLREGQNVLLSEPVVANAAPSGCGEEQYTLTISEQFHIDSRNQVINLLPEASIVMPKTLTAVVSLLQLRKGSVHDVCGPQKDNCPFYVVQTQCDHEYLPGLLFYLLLGGGQSVRKHDYDPKPSCDENPYRKNDDDDDDNDDDNDGFNHVPEEKAAYCEDPLRPGATTPCLEVLEILDSTRFLARLVGTVSDTPPSFQAFLKRKVMRPQFSSTVFTGPNSTGLAAASRVEPQQFLWCDPQDPDQYEYCKTYYKAIYCIESKSLCQHGPCGAGMNACARKEAQCGGAVAYIPPPTSPCELAEFADCVVQQVRDFMITEYEQNGTALHPLVDVSGVAYEPQTDTYVVKRYSTGGFVRWRTLLNTRTHGDTSALNFPLRRRPMVATETAVDAKQRYLNGVFDGFHWFVVCKGVNDCFCVELRDKQRFRVCVPAGCYRPDAFANSLEKAMNAVVPVDEPYQFVVRFSLHPVHALTQFINEEVTRPKANKRPDHGFPSCRNEPYQVQAFAFTIENTEADVFSLLFDNARAFAALVDFEPRRYDDETRFVSRALAPLQCLPQSSMPRCVIGADCAPCPRRRYRAFVDAQCGFTTLTQEKPHPIECTPVERDDDCECDTGDCVWLQCTLCEGGEDDEEVDETSSGSSCGSCGGDEKEKEEEECASSKKPACLPFCVGDVVWFEAKAPACDRCHSKHYDDLDDECQHRKKPAKPLVGSVVLCVRQDPYDPCIYYVAVHIDFDHLVSSRVTPSPVGFNLHLHPALPPLDSEKPNLSSNERLASQKSAVARWLGFTKPFTRSDCRSYTSNAAPQSILDERLILRIPELVTLGLSEQRENHYHQVSPFDRILSENYNVLALDRARGAYRFDAASAGPSLGLGIGLVPPSNVLAPQTASQQPCTPSLTFQLYRPDGTPYETGGFALVASLEVVYC